MTREEAIELCEHGACGGPVVYGDLKERMKMWAELAALLREPAAPGLTESEMSDLIEALQTIQALENGSSPLTDRLSAIIVRHTPLHKVEWHTEGVIDSASIDGRTLMVRPNTSGPYWVSQIWHGTALQFEDYQKNNRDAAKHAAEAKLAELMREGK